MARVTKASANPGRGRQAKASARAPKLSRAPRASASVARQMAQSVPAARRGGR